MDNKVWKYTALVVGAILIIVLIKTQLMDKPKIKITELEVWDEVEEGDEIDFDFCWYITIPADGVTMTVFTEPPLLSSSCFEFEDNKDLYVWKIGEPICSYHRIKARPNLTTECMREHTLRLRIDGMGLEAEKTAKFKVIPTNSYYCRKCDRICQ